MKRIVFVLCLILGMICLPVEAVVITPSNIVMPTLAGDTFSFDLIIDDPGAVPIMAFQSTFSVSGPGLTFDAAASKAVEFDSDYWIVGNSDAIGFTSGSNYIFGDNSSNALPEVLATDDVMARYSFTWDGTEGDYTFSLDLDALKSFVLNSTWNQNALEFTSGDYTGDASSFTVTIPEVPEPTTLALFTLGGLMLRRRRA